MMDSLSALHIHVQGVVQGLGFRPFVYGLATKLCLKGWVLNTTSVSSLKWKGLPYAKYVPSRSRLRQHPPSPGLNTWKANRSLLTITSVLKFAKVR